MEYRERARDSWAGGNLVKRTPRVQAGIVEHGDDWMALRGEFDQRDRGALRAVLRTAHRRECEVTVDLSGVTFLDVGCARELAFWSLLDPDQLVLADASWQARATAVACGLGAEKGFAARRTDGTDPKA